MTLPQTAYKVYASVLADRLREEVEEKNLLPLNQTGFRRGEVYRITYVLNCLLNRQVGRKKW